MRYLVFCITMLLCVSGFAQSKKDKLQQEYAATLAEIEKIEALISQTEAQKKESLHQLQSVKAKIETREKLISNVQSQLLVVEQEIKETNAVITSLQADLVLLKEEYAQMIDQSYKNLQQKNHFVFIFSSDNFNQALQRFNYLRTYASFRKNQAELIEKTMLDLEAKRTLIEKEREAKQLLLNEETAQKESLQIEKESYQTLYVTLEDQEEDLLQQAQDKNDAAAKLNAQIQQIIEEEIRLAKEKAAQNSSGSESFALTPEEKQLSSDFVSNKGKLPWPVLKGHIVERFGKRPHPTLKNIYVENNGIDIRTEENAQVRAVFDGEVINTFYLPTTQNSIIVKHGEYFSVYSHLKTVLVSPGDRIFTKEAIGEVYNTEGNVSIVHLEIWKGIQKMNPEIWLSAF